MTTTEEPSLFGEIPPKTPTKWQNVPEEQIAAVFTTWCQAHGKKRAKLTPERHRKIAKAILTYGPEMVAEAIHGCLLSEWHMGRNPQRKCYNDISLILRNAEKIEHFADLYHAQNNAGGFLDDV